MHKVSGYLGMHPSAAYADPNTIEQPEVPCIHDIYAKGGLASHAVEGPSKKLHSVCAVLAAPARRHHGQTYESGVGQSRPCKPGVLLWSG